MMNRLLTGSFVAFAIASGPAFACAEPPAAHVARAAEAKSKAAAVEAKLKTAGPAVAAKSRMAHPVVETKAKVDPAVEAQFEAADEDNSGTLEGAEVEDYKPALAQIDTNQDGKVSRAEFAAAVKAGAIE
jgi:uncharacterized protein YciI